MLDAICQLTQARPHMRKTARYNTQELGAYHDGYYTGCVMALRVAELAIEHFKLTKKTLRAAARTKRSA